MRSVSRGRIVPSLSLAGVRPPGVLPAERVDTTRSEPHELSIEGRPQRLLSISAAAEYLGVSRATVERLVYRGELAVVKVGGSTRYDVFDLHNYVEIHRRRNRKRTA